MQNTRSAKIKNKQIWIETAKDASGKRILNIGFELGCTRGFSKQTTKKLFEAVTAAVKSVIPNADINPRTNAKHFFTNAKHFFFF